MKKSTEKLFDLSELNTFVSGVDYLINILPETKQTVGLLSGNVLSKCKPSCVFVNVGRGSIISEASLIKAITEKWISMAILDVVAQEPLREDNILWKLPNVIITPHIAADPTAKDVAFVFSKNLELYTEKQPLQYLVDMTEEY